MENRDFNKRILNRLEEKIAIEEFRKENNIQKKKKSNVFFKVASFITVLGVIGANLYTYATFKQDVITYVLDKLGIFNEDNKESLVQVNETKESNDITLTLENYAIENDILIIGYKLRADKDADLGVKYIIDDTNLISNDKTYHLDKSTSSALSQINDTEYELFKIYNIGNIEITNNDILKTRLFLPMYLDIGDHAGEWEFEIDLKPHNFTSKREKYVVENIGGIWNDADEDYWFEHSFSVLEVENTDMFTKLVILLHDYLTGGEKYTVEVTDENGNIILEDDIQNLFGGVPTEVIVKKLDLSSKIIINVYEKEEATITKKASTVLDLSKDLKIKEEKEVEYTTTKWKDLKFKYDKEIKPYKTTNSNYYTGSTYDYIDFGLYTMVGNIKDTTRDGSIQITCNENEFKNSLEEIFEEYKAINTVSWSNWLYNDKYYICLDGGIELILNHDQMLELSKNKEITVNDITINDSNYEFSNIEFRDIQNIKIKDIDAITWTEYNDKMYMFVYKGNYYEIRTPNTINAMQRVEEFINNIEFI